MKVPLRYADKNFVVKFVFFTVLSVHQVVPLSRRFMFQYGTFISCPFFTYISKCPIIFISFLSMEQSSCRASAVAALAVAALAVAVFAIVNSDDNFGKYQLKHLVLLRENSAMQLKVNMFAVTKKSSAVFTFRVPTIEYRFLILTVSVRIFYVLML